MKRWNTTRTPAAWAASAVLPIWLTSALGAGCVLSTTPRDECRADSECYEAFGLGTICGSDGYCEARPTNARCTRTFPEDLLDPARGAAYKDHVIFGNVAPYEIPLFRQIADSSMLAIKHVNDRGGIDGTRAFGMIMCDAAPATAERFDDGLATSQQASVAVARYLVDAWSVPAIVGPIRSSEVEQAFLELRDDGVLMVSPSATSPDLRQLDVTAPSDDQPGLLWRSVPADDLQSQAIAEDMIAPGPGRTSAVDQVAVIYLNDTYGTALFNAFAAAFEAPGSNRDAQAFPFSSDDGGQNLSQVVAQVATQANFDEVLVVSSTPDDFVDFFNVTATNPSFDGKGIFVTEAAVSTDVLNNANSARFSQVRGSRPRPLDRGTDTVYETFLAEYQVFFGEAVVDQIFTPNAYDAGWILAAGATWAAYRANNQITGVNMAKGLRKLSAGPEVEVSENGWPTLRSNFEAGRAVNIRGASGSLDFEPGTEETESPIQIWTITSSRTVSEIDVWEP
jgi:ABC-type branched-subunit amino acid transport system substrate-binding protein